VKFTATGQVFVDVSLVRRDADRALIHMKVMDTGIGIPKDKIDAVFEAFRQTDSSTTRKFGGTGLGLSISMQLVHLMEGKIWLESELGVGSTFHCEIPLAASSFAAPTVEWSAADERPTALLIGSNADARRIYGEMLASSGVEVTRACATDAVVAGAQSFGWQDADGAQVVVLDLSAATQAEIDLASQIMKVDAEARPALVMLMPAGQVDAAERCRKLGVTQTLIKPVKVSELRRAIRAALSPESQPTVEQADHAALVRSMPARPVRILVADDSPVNQEVARGLLELRGHHVTTANDGREAAELFAAGEFDLVLMDIEMPELDGLGGTRLIRQIEAERGGRRTPVIALSAHALKGYSEECQSAGMDGYIAKPIRPDELFQAVETAAEASVSVAASIA
jgi:CheY-like chemotaxis protein